MPKADYSIFNDEEVVIIGWGQYRQEGDDFVIPDRLQKALVPVIDHVTCTDVLEGHWPGFYEIDFMNENNFCTGPINGNINVCTHDSGGPVLQPSEFGWLQIGVISWAGNPCGLIDVSGHVFTAVFLEWMENIRKNYENN